MRTYSICKSKNCNNPPRMEGARICVVCFDRQKEEKKAKVAAYKKEYAEKHKESIKNYKKRNYLENKEKIQKKHLEYAKKNKDKLQVANKEYYAKNKDTLLRDYLQKNRTKRLAKKREDYQKNKEKQLLRAKKYRDNNREKINLYTKTRKAQDPAFKIACQIRIRMREVLRTAGTTKKNKTFELIGCDKNALMEHLSSKFMDGMTWDNHGNYGWHIDHIIPLSHFDLLDPDQQKKAFNYTNLQPLWAKENISKGDRYVG